MQPSRHAKPEREMRSAFRAFADIPTRWSDNDLYGHVNNVVYYSWFDTAVNAWLIRNGLLNLRDGATIWVVAETHCNFFESVAFPEPVQVGLRLAHMGTTSVRYDIGVFGTPELALARGHFVHVHVDAATRRPLAIPQSFVTTLETLR